MENGSWRNHLRCQQNQSLVEGPLVSPRQPHTSTDGAKSITYQNPNEGHTFQGGSTLNSSWYDFLRKVASQWTKCSAPPKSRSQVPTFLVTVVPARPRRVNVMGGIEDALESCNLRTPLDQSWALPDQGATASKENSGRQRSREAPWRERAV